MTNVAAAVNVNVTVVNGEMVQVGSLPAVLVAVVVTEKGLRDFTTDANTKIVVHMTATTKSVSSLDPVPLPFPPSPLVPPISPPVIFNHLENRSHRTLKAALVLSAGRYQHSLSKKRERKSALTSLRLSPLL